MILHILGVMMCVSLDSQEQFHDRTPYTIMFGPDKCGEDYKLHFIFIHKNPFNGDVEEKHAKRPDIDLKKIYTDKKTHLFTLGVYTYLYSYNRKHVETHYTIVIITVII